MGHVKLNLSDMYELLPNVSKLTVVDRMSGPKEIHVLVPGAGERVMLHGEGKLRSQVE